MKSAVFGQQDDERVIETWTPSVCGLCSIGCGLEIASIGNEIAGVRGRSESPVNRGRLGTGS